MPRHQHKVSAMGQWAFTTVLLNTIILKLGLTSGPGWYWALPLTLPAMAQAVMALARERRDAVK